MSDIQDFARHYVVDSLSGQNVHVDKCSIHFVIAGTSCVDISAENPKRAELAGCVEEGTNSSGGTWQGFLDVLQLLRPSAALSENVAAMFWKFPVVKRTHAEAMLDHVKQLSYVAAPNLIESRETGLAQRRTRGYIPMAAGTEAPTSSMAFLTAVRKNLALQLPGCPARTAPNGTHYRMTITDPEVYLNASRTEPDELSARQLRCWNTVKEKAPVAALGPLSFANLSPIWAPLSSPSPISPPVLCEPVFTHEESSPLRSYFTADAGLAAGPDGNIDMPTDAFSGTYQGP